MNDYLTSFTVSEEYDKQRLDIFVTRVCDFIPSRSFASKLIDNHKITVNGKNEKSSFKVTKEQIVRVDCSFLNEINAEPIGEKIPLNILFEDEHLIVIDKPAGMVVHPGAGVSSGTLVNAILAHCGSTLPSLGSSQRAGIVHRLDRDTSGVMVVAKSQIALTELSKQFADHSQIRIYQTIIYGVPNNLNATIETWHGRDPKNRIKYAVLPEGIGKKAILNYSVKENLASQLFALVECKLFTGRTHQIRVQMASIKHGIVGDALYFQVPSQVKNNKIVYSFITKSIERQMLHAAYLGFKHPLTTQDMLFHAPLPQDFSNFLHFLRSLS